MNGDGYDDVIVCGSPENGSAIEPPASVALYFGSALGLASVPVWRVTTPQPGSKFGHRCEGVGDLNHDGCADVAVGAYEYVGQTSIAGAVFAYYGGTGGPSLVADAVVYGYTGQQAVGLAFAGTDINKDGYDDLLVSCSKESVDVPYLTSAVRVLYGSAAGIDTGTYALVVDPFLSPGTFGCDLSPVGDVNGDGIQDILVGSMGAGGGEFYPDGLQGEAYVLAGGLSGCTTDVLWRTDGPGYYSCFGRIARGIGDVNNDGYPDILVTAQRWIYAPTASSNEYKAFLYTGGPAGATTSAVWQVKEQVIAPFDDYFGERADRLGDVNGDGYDDFAICSLQKAYVFYGCPDAALSAGLSLATGEATKVV